ncbi:hypothetical protein D3C81_1268100 [compost metagenome]
MDKQGGTQGQRAAGDKAAAQGDRAEAAHPYDAVERALSGAVRQRLGLDELFLIGLLQQTDTGFGRQATQLKLADFPRRIVERKRSKRVVIRRQPAIAHHRRAHHNQTDQHTFPSHNPSS